MSKPTVILSLTLALGGCAKTERTQPEELPKRTEFTPSASKVDSETHTPEGTIVLELRADKAIKRGQQERVKVLVDMLASKNAMPVGHGCDHLTYPDDYDKNAQVVVYL